MLTSKFRKAIAKTLKEASESDVFSKGDEVCIKKDYRDKNFAGKCGTIIALVRKTQVKVRFKDLEIDGEKRKESAHLFFLTDLQLKNK